MGSSSDPGAMEVCVIARIPDLDAPSQPMPNRRRSSRSRAVKQPSTTGRLLSAGLSLNLLIGLGLVIFLGAVASSVYTRFTDNTHSNSANATGRAWQQPPPAPTAALAPAWKPLSEQPRSSSQSWPNMVESKAKGPAALLPSDNALAMNKDKTVGDPNVNMRVAANAVQRDMNIVQSNITTPLIGSRAKETLAPEIKSAADLTSGMTASLQPGESTGSADMGQSSPWPRIADDQANFSTWPNPAHPIISATDPRRNEPFMADRRYAPVPGAAAGAPAQPLDAPNTAQPGSANDAGNAQFEGTINTPSDRNIYERTRPSIH
jgi:hypothetical protein